MSFRLIKLPQINLKFYLSPSKENEFFVCLQIIQLLFLRTFFCVAPDIFFLTSTNQSKYRVVVISSLNKFQIKNEEDSQLSSLDKQIIHIM